MNVSFIIFCVMCLGSMFAVGDLAQALGRKQWRWIWVAAVIGPFAIPMLCLVAAISALMKMMSVRRT